MAHEERDTRSQRSTTTEVRAQDKPSREAGRAGLETRRESGLRSWGDPFDSFRRFVERFERWPFGTAWNSPFETSARRRGLAGLWTPQVESFQRGDQFIVRADLPGLERGDVQVEVEDDALVISGERSSEEQHQDDGYYTSERSYGRFCRVIPLPDGAIQDSAKATFQNGVLEVSVQAPPREVRQGRRIEITGGEPRTAR
jgi:HSP20 family protein